MSDATDKKTLVDEGSELKGSLTSKCPVVVRGSVDGEINAPSLRVSESGSVSGKVRVTELVSEGQLAGEYDAEVVRLSGRLKDATIIRARTLEVTASPSAAAGGDEKMRVVFGEATLEIGDIAPPETHSVAPPGGRRKPRE